MKKQKFLLIIGLMSLIYINAYDVLAQLEIGLMGEISLTNLEIQYVRFADSKIEISVENLVLKGYITPNGTSSEPIRTYDDERAPILFEMKKGYPIEGTFNIGEICHTGGEEWCTYVKIIIDARDKTTNETGHLKYTMPYSSMEAYSPVDTRKILITLLIGVVIIVGIMYSVKRTEKAYPQKEIKGKENLPKEQLKKRLKERYISGEISRNEYLEMKKELEEDY